jgi:hypothetical protein
MRNVFQKSDDQLRGPPTEVVAGLLSFLSKFSPLFPRHGLARNYNRRLRKFRLKVARAWHAKLEIDQLASHGSRWFLEPSGPADPSRLSATRLTLVLAEVNRHTPVQRMG